MTKQEIDKLILAGEPLEMFFGSTKDIYSVGNYRITEKQFNEARKRFYGKLNFKINTGGFTRHIYTIKPQENEQ